MPEETRRYLVTLADAKQRRVSQVAECPDPDEVCAKMATQWPGHRIIKIKPLAPEKGK